MSSHTPSISCFADDRYGVCGRLTLAQACRVNTRALRLVLIGTTGQVTRVHMRMRFPRTLDRLFKYRSNCSGIVRKCAPGYLPVPCMCYRAPARYTTREPQESVQCSPEHQPARNRRFRMLGCTWRHERFLLLGALAPMTVNSGSWCELWCVSGRRIGPKRHTQHTTTPSTVMPGRAFMPQQPSITWFGRAETGSMCDVTCRPMPECRFAARLIVYSCMPGCRAYIRSVFLAPAGHRARITPTRVLERHKGNNPTYTVRSAGASNVYDGCALGSRVHPRWPDSAAADLGSPGTRNQRTPRTHLTSILGLAPAGQDRVVSAARVSCSWCVLAGWRWLVMPARQAHPTRQNQQETPVITVHSYARQHQTWNTNRFSICCSTVDDECCTIVGITVPVTLLPEFMVCACLDRISIQGTKHD